MSLSVAGAHLRKRRRRIENTVSSIPPSNQTETLLRENFNGEIKKAEYFQYFGNPKYLTLEQGQFVMEKRLQELDFVLSPSQTTSQ